MRLAAELNVLAQSFNRLVVIHPISAGRGLRIGDPEISHYANGQYATVPAPMIYKLS